MRWGVGKGRFRNLTAVFLCILLAATFYAVWTFFQHIKPLTIDTSAQSSTASVAERLLNTRIYSSDTLNEAQLLMFTTIADSLDAVVRNDLRAVRLKKGKLNAATIQELLVDMQENVRRKLGMMLNETYTSASEYRFIERKILAAFNALNANTEESAIEREIIEHPAVENAQQIIAALMDTTQVTKRDKELVREFVPHLRSRLFAFATGLSSDDVKFIEYKAATQSQDEKPIKPPAKQKKGKANAN